MTKSSAKHIAIIMDGNNRWAKKKFLGGIAGHKAAQKAVRQVVEFCANKEVEVLTLFAFSSENWKRPKEEVGALMELFLIALQREVKKLHKNNIRLKIIGDVSGFNDKIQMHIKQAEALTQDNTGLILAVAANYGGRWDIVNATQKVAQLVKDGKLEPQDITEQHLQEFIQLGDLPEPDLCIRTANEQRISNFLLWQFAYSEFYFTDVLWPDFGKADLQKAMDAFEHRTRRFGKTDDQIAKENN